MKFFAKPTVHGLLFLACLSLLPLAGCQRDEQLDFTKKAFVGQPAPDFKLMDLQGRQWRLDQLHGKVVFLNFWATWCPPCMEEMPSMETLNEHMPHESVQMLTILYKDRPEFAKIVSQDLKLSFPVLLDAEAGTAVSYQITGVPETFIIDSQGILREKIIGPQDWGSAESLALVERYLPGNNAAASGQIQMEKSH